MVVYIQKSINFKRDEILESVPVCLKEGNSEEIYCMGMLTKRQIAQGDYEGLPYYQFVYFFGKSPVNFSDRDYVKMHNDYSFDTDLEMVADFRYCYSQYSSNPGILAERNIVQVSKSFRNL